MILELAFAAAQAAAVSAPVASWELAGGELRAWDCSTSVQRSGRWTRECRYYNGTDTKSCHGDASPESRAVVAAVRHAEVAAAVKKGDAVYARSGGGDSFDTALAFTIGNAFLRLYSQCPDLGARSCIGRPASSTS